MINLHFGKNYREVNSEEQGINGRKSKPERKHWFQKTKKTGLVVLGVVLVLLLAEFLLVYDSGGRTGGRLYIWNTEGSDRSGTSF